jgi:multidrug efflux system membrane fusion protein
VLWPGQFVSVTLTVGSDADAIVVPEAAVKAGPNGSYVFVVKADGRAEQRSVDVARTVGGETVITRGLGAGESVVTDGQSRLVDGTRVKTSAEQQQASITTKGTKGAKDERSE